MKMRKIKILVVDDEQAEEIKENIQEFTYKNPGAGIKTAVGCEIETATNIDEAEKKISNLKVANQFYDIIIIDMKIGKNDAKGLELVKHVLKLSSIKIILTAFASIPNCVDCLNEGASDYVEKNAVGYDPYEKLKSAMKKGLDERLKPPFDPFMRWLNQKLAKFTEEYSGERIAVIDEIVVEHDLDPHALMERVKKNYPFHHPIIATIPRKEDKECLFLQ